MIAVSGPAENPRGPPVRSQTRPDEYVGTCIDNGADVRAADEVHTMHLVVLGRVIKMGAAVLGSATRTSLNLTCKR